MSADDVPNTAVETITPSITTPPDDVPPSVGIGLPATARAGVPTTIQVYADPGTRWVWSHNTWQAAPMVTFTQTEVGIGYFSSDDEYLNGLTTYPGGGGTYPETFSRATNYGITATCTTSGGEQYSAGGRNLTVVEAGPPAFTVVSPVQGAVVGLGPAGGPVNVQLSSGTDQYYPLTVHIAYDGKTTSDQYSGTVFQKTITLAPAPLGARTISVTCTDPAGHTATQTRTVTGQDGAPPTVTINAPDPVLFTMIPQPVTITGTTSGAPSGVTGVSFSFDKGGPSGAATDTSAAHDWSKWQVNTTLPVTGMYSFTVTATDNRGGTGFATGTITLHT